MNRLFDVASAFAMLSLGLAMLTLTILSLLIAVGVVR